MSIQNNPGNDKIRGFKAELAVGESAAGVSVIAAVEPGFKLLFNPLTTLNSVTGSATFAGLSATPAGFVGNDLTVHVDTAYNGAEFAVINPNRQSSFTEYTTGAGTQSMTANGFGAVSPTARRLVALGYM